MSGISIKLLLKNVELVILLLFKNADLSVSLSDIHRASNQFSFQQEKPTKAFGEGSHHEDRHSGSHL